MTDIRIRICEFRGFSRDTCLPKREFTTVWLIRARQIRFQR